MAFIAPLIAAIGGSSIISSVAAAAGGFALQHLLKPKKNVAAPDPAVAAAQKVVPLPVDTGSATKLRVAQQRMAASQRRGFSSTLVGGQLGDVAPPSTAPPLVLGRAG